MRRALFACTVLVAAACGGGGAADDRVEVVSEGEGEENVEPLDFARRPMRRTSADHAPVAVIDAAIGDRARYYYDDRGYPVSDFSDLVVGAGPGVSLEVYATSLDGALAIAIPLVPEKVRVGRKWRVVRSGEPLYEFEVTARAVEKTLHGERPVWTIRQTNVRTGNVVTRRYVEGRGQIGVDARTGATLGAAVVPLDDVTAAPEPELAASPLEPVALPDSKPLEDLVVTSASFVRPHGKTSGVLILRGHRACVDGPNGVCDDALCYGFDGKTAVERPITGGVSSTYHAGETCVRQTYGVHGARSNGVALDASGAWVMPHTIYWIPRGAQGLRRDFPAFALYSQGKSGDARILHASFNGVDDFSASTFRASPLDAVSFPDEFPLAGQWFFLDALRGALGTAWEGGNRSRNARVSLGGDPQMVLTLSKPGDPPEFALITQKKLLMHSRLEAGALTDPELVTTLAGQIGVTADENGQHLTLATPSGRADRVVVRNGRLVREAIARANLSPPEFLTHALDLSGTAEGNGRLLFVTHWQEGRKSKVGLYTVAAQTPVEWPFTRATGVVAAARGLDVLVCWPRTDAPLDRTGWTIAGKPARLVLPSGDRCAWIMRDVDADPFLRGRDLLATFPVGSADKELRAVAYDTVGPVPGVGRVAFAVPIVQSFAAYSPPIERKKLAVLAGGGYATPNRLWTEGMVEWRAPTVRMSDGTDAIADLGGAGLWLLTNGPVALVGRESFVLPRPPLMPPGAIPIRIPAEGGGLLLGPGAPGGGWYFASAKDRTIVDTARLLPGFSPFARTRDGTICGAVDDAIACMDASGVETSRVKRSIEASHQFLAYLADGTMVLSVATSAASTQLVRFDRKTNALTPYADNATVHYQQVRYALDGTPFVVRVNVDNGERTAGKLTPTGFVQLDVSEWRKRAYLAGIGTGGVLLSLIPAGELLWVELSGGYVAIPMPK